MKALNIPNGIKLADAQSEENYQRAMDGDLNEYGFRPIIVITASAPGTGKTRLARHILQERTKEAAASMVPTKKTQWLAEIPAALKRGYLLLDNVISPLKSQELAALVTSKRWSFRKFGSQEYETMDVDLVVVITGNNVELSGDLERRALRIHLA